MTAAPVEVAARLLAERTGMRLDGGLRERLAACLEGVARGSGQALERHVAGLADDPGAFQRLLDCVTVQESAFFRHPEQFAALERAVLPALQGPIRVWSAGCGNGEEAYSLAMLLAASGHPDWQVLATDLSSAAVARARAGRYTTAELTGLPPAHRRWLRQVGELWEVDPGLRRRVRIQRANLTSRFPIEPGRCQIVFCRNVLVYLARPEAEAFLDRLADWLAPGGLVFLGYADAALAPTDRLRVERFGSTSALRAVQVAPDDPVHDQDPTRDDEPARPDRPARRRRSDATASPARPDDRAAARAGSPAADPARPRLPATPSEEAAALVAAGEAAAADGDHLAAVAAFRKAIFVDPDQPAVWFQLGLALEAVPDRRGARRAYLSGLAALERCDPDTVRDGLGGWRAGELAGVLQARLDGRTEPDPDPADSGQGGPGP